MSAKYAKKSVTLEGNITVEEAEALATWLKKNPLATVKLSRCEHLHAAALQVLLALKPRLEGAAQDPWLRAALWQSSK
jgi:hypothetical protein